MQKNTLPHWEANAKWLKVNKIASRPIINIVTGVIFPSIKEAAESVGMSYSSLRQRVAETAGPNTSNFRYHGSTSPRRRRKFSKPIN